ncbi:unnamed protein product [Clonostachys rhizophaga]|uniref:Uncharacterized protein n=1 Tax=Clonostachys rhizophaga TaxID=160324 RepID=A0A9N9YKY9_9HYPO|nr:unnamed protein product [Clonostachys rhizophaga]
MSLHIRQSLPQQLLMAIYLAFLLPSLASAAPVDILGIKVHTRDTSDDGYKINPGMVAGVAFGILFGMSILFTVIRAIIERRRFASSIRKSPSPPPVASTAPNAPRVVLVSEESPIQEPLPAYKLESPVKMTEEEIEYHSILATRTQRPPSYSSTAETLNESLYTVSSFESSDTR